MRLTCLLLIGSLGVALTACGGESSLGGNDPDAGASGGSAGSGASGGSAGSSGSGGSTGGSAGTAGSASGGSGGSSGSAGSGGSGGGTTCGGLGGGMCGANEFCDYTPDHCGATDGTGTCKPKPSGCPDNCPGVCSCDGTFYCNECDAQAAGMDVSTSRSCLLDDGGTVKPCGGMQNLKCAADEYCDYTYAGKNYCGGDDSTGECKKRPTSCPNFLICPEACGCDGKYYCSDCEAHMAGTDDLGSDKSSCQPQGDGGVGTQCTKDAQCGAGLKCCYPCGIAGCQNQCIVPDPSGNCPLFP